MTRNLLADSLSPYLLQHKDNPVHWRPWGAQALAQARDENKPILLSIGYSSCHWCHVMAHESFSDADIAARMNAHFVNIKVDREERPDIDAVYMRALQLMGGQGGWPLTMFLTPDAKPFWGGTYFPPRSAYGRPGFDEVLDAVSRAFRDKRDEIEAGAASLLERLKSAPDAQSPRAGSTAPDNRQRPSLQTEEIRDHSRFVRHVEDPIYGGFPSGAPKFPQTQALELLWRAWRRDQDSRAKEAVERALTAMCRGGIYDHLGGGFCRYSTDRQWHVPHFEKMLYDNAMLAPLLAWVWRDGGNDLYRRRLEETIGWMLREMRLPGGAFASSQDADSPDEGGEDFASGEGAFHVWSEAEIDALLGDESALFKSVYDVTAGGNWEGACILNQNRSKESADAEEERLAPLRARLFAERENRPRPQRDDKILADWNGLAIAALAQAAAVLGRTEWMTAAAECFTCVTAEMSDGVRLFHARRGEARSERAFSSDYANMIRAALLLHQLHDGDCASGEQGGEGNAPNGDAYLRHALEWIDVLDADYADGGGGYFDTRKEAGAEALVARPRAAEDGAQPCANFVMAECFATLSHLTGGAEWRQRCEALLASEARDMRNRAFSLAGLLCAADQLRHAARVEVFGGGEGADALVEAARRASGPGLVVVRRATRDEAQEPSAVICRGERCGLPIQDAEMLRRQLAGGVAP